MPRTIFILGAGASLPYGFPLGSQLINDIIAYTKNTRQDTSRLYTLLRENFTAQEIDKFRSHIAATDVNSIDSFLYHNPDYLEIGKASMACLLLECEARSGDFHEVVETDHWYKYLWNELVNEEPANYDFKIYTFNYERSLKEYLEHQTNFLIPSKERRGELLENIKIIHLHGSLGEVRYGRIDKVLNYTDLKEIADNIKIIFEVETDENFKNLQNDIQNSTNVVFVGFGFHADNMKRLGFLTGEFKRLPHFYASTYGLKQAQVDTKFIKFVRSSLYRHFKHHVKNISPYVDYSNAKNLEFLTELFPFHNLFKR